MKKEGEIKKMGRKTKYCIVCLKENTFCSTGHLREFASQHIDNTIDASFCIEHRNTPCPDIIEEGCYGFYNKCYGLVIEK